MRFSLFFMFLFIFSAVAENSQSQNLSVSINKDNASLKTILDEIESQTDYLFIYKSDIDIMAIKSIHAEKTPVSDVLNKLFAKSNISYEMVGNHIILSKKGEMLVDQQNHAVRGQVVDANGEPVIGANVVEEKTVEVEPTEKYTQTKKKNLSTLIYSLVVVLIFAAFGGVV